MAERFTCPVCGYAEMEQPPKDFAICPQCMTEFGYDDYSRSHEDLRAEWLKRSQPNC